MCRRLLPLRIERQLNQLLRHVSPDTLTDRRISTMEQNTLTTGLGVGGNPRYDKENNASRARLSATLDNTGAGASSIFIVWRSTLIALRGSFENSKIGFELLD